MSTYTTPAASTTTPAVADVAAIHAEHAEPIPYRLADLDEPVPYSVVEDVDTPAVGTDVTALGIATRDALLDLALAQQLLRWDTGEVTVADVDRAAGAFDELLAAYRQAVAASKG